MRFNEIKMIKKFDNKILLFQLNLDNFSFISNKISLIAANDAGFGTKT
jgi:hypothetical protein